MTLSKRYCVLKDSAKPLKYHAMLEKYMSRLKKKIILYIPPQPKSLFRKKRFMLDEMTRRNASKFAIFYIYENPKLLYPFFISCYFTLFPNE